MSSKKATAANHAKRGPKPFARVEIYAVREEIDSKLACGHTLISVWRELCESGVIHVGYSGFCYTWQRIRAKQPSNPKSIEDTLDFNAVSTSKSALDASSAVADILDQRRRQSAMK